MSVLTRTLREKTILGGFLPTSTRESPVFTHIHRQEGHRQRQIRGDCPQSLQDADPAVAAKVLQTRSSPSASSPSGPSRLRQSLIYAERLHRWLRGVLAARTADAVAL